MIGIAIKSGEFEVVCGEPPGRCRPLDPATVATLESYSQRHAALLATADPAPGLLALGRDLYRFLDGDAGELTVSLDRAQPPLRFEIISASAEPGQAGLALVRVPWELLANDRGFLAADEVLGFQVVRRFGLQQSVPLSTAAGPDRGEGEERTAEPAVAISGSNEPSSPNASAAPGSASRSTGAASGRPHRRSGSSRLAPNAAGSMPLPDRESALSTADWHAMLALVGEVGEIASSASAEAHAHLTAGVAKLIGAGPMWWTVIGGTAGADDMTGSVTRSHVHGLDPDTQRRWEQEYLRECRYEDHPMWPRVFAGAGQPRSFLRRDVVDDDLWYRSTHVSDWTRGFGVNDMVTAVVPVGNGAELCILGMRPWGDREFGVREREAVALLTMHTAWLARRPNPLAVAAGSRNGIAEEIAGLAPRHRAVLELLVAGHREKQIAAALQVSPRTAHKYVEQIYRAFDVSSRAELMALFIKR